MGKSYRTLQIEGSIFVKSIVEGLLLAVGPLGKIRGIDPSIFETKIIPAAVQTLTATSSIAVTSEVLPIRSASAITLMSAPTIQTTNLPSGLAVVRLINVGSTTITFQSQGLLMNSKLSLGSATTRALAAGLSIQFVFYQGLWYLSA